MSRLLQTTTARALLVTLASCALALALARTGVLAQYDRALSDLSHRLRGKRADATHVGLVMVDAQSLRAHANEPLVAWGPHFARALKVLRQVGAQVVAVDFHFGVSIEEWFQRLKLPTEAAAQTFDLPLRAEVAEGGIILAGGITEGEGGALQLDLPTFDLLAVLPNGAADVGLANLVPGPDGVVRTFVPAVSAEGDPPRLTFATLAAVQARGLDPAAPRWAFGNLDVPSDLSEVPVRWLGPPGTVRAISFQRLLVAGAEQDPEVQRLKGHVVIVGSDSFGLHDFHQTPYGRMMAGAEIQANIVETLLDGVPVTPVPGPGRWALMALFAALAALAGLRWRIWPSALATVGLGALSLGAAYALLLGDRPLALGEIHVALGAAFVLTLGVRLTGEERRRGEITRLFARYVSDDVVEHLVKQGSLPNLGGEAAQVTVLFSDIRNFTTISERLTAQEVVKMLNAYFTLACEPILREGGTIDKFIGDAIMAVFGSPAPHADHALRAIRAALEMERIARQFSAWMHETFPGRDLPEFGVGIGIHSGEAVTGNIGHPKRMEFTAIGDTVNTASRLEGVTKVLGVMTAISAETVAAAGVPLVLGKREEMHVKGRAQPVMVHELLGIGEGAQ